MNASYFRDRSLITGRGGGKSIFTLHKKRVGGGGGDTFWGSFNIGPEGGTTRFHPLKGGCVCGKIYPVLGGGGGGTKCFGFSHVEAPLAIINDRSFTPCILTY